jgi:hypothetical protein
VRITGGPRHISTRGGTLSLGLQDVVLEEPVLFLHDALQIGALRFGPGLVVLLEGQLDDRFSPLAAG